MVRLQIQLEASRHRELKRRARRLGISVSEVIRRCVDAQLREDEADGPGARVKKAMAVAGKYTDPAGRDDVAARHDDALAAAFGAVDRAPERRR